MATVFFSWQSDRPTGSGRNFVEKALREAIKDLRSDAELHEAFREDLSFDKDTQGIAGSPPIVETIFRKIDAATVFVPDLTFVGSRPDGRPTPNPNVLIEYGWALKTLSFERIVPVMNDVFGVPTSQTMPFDMAHLRFPITYSCAEGATEDERKAARAKLRNALGAALKAVLTSQPPSSAVLAQPFPRRSPGARPSVFRELNEPLGRTHNRIPFGESTDVLINNSSGTWLRVMPSADLGKEFSTLELEKALWPQNIPSPLNNHGGGLYLVRANDGFGTYASATANTTPAAFFVFKSGEVWTWDSTILSHDPSKLYLNEKNYYLALNHAIAIMKTLGIEGPYQWVAGVEGLRGRKLAPIGAVLPPFSHAYLSDVIIREGTIQPEDREPLLPFFRALYEDVHQTR